MLVVTTWTARDVRALRGAMLMSQKEFADVVCVNERTIKRWEGGLPIGRDGHADLDTQVGRLTPTQSARFSALLAGDSDPDSRAASQAESAQKFAACRPDASAIELVRGTLHAAMQLDDKLGSPAAIGLVTVQRQLTKAMLADCVPTLKPSLLSLYAEWHGLEGSLAADVGDHASAAEHYSEAHELAHDAKDPDLAAYLLCHMSQLEVWLGHPRMAMSHAVDARSWAAQSKDQRLRAYVEIRLADAAARSRERMEALRALDNAARSLDGLSPCCHPSESRAYFVGPGLLESYRGLTLTHLGDSLAAAAASRRAVEQIPGEFTRDRAVTLLELAQPLERLGDIDEAASAIGEAAELTERNRSPRLAASIGTARRRLSPWAGTSAVRELDQQLADRDIVTR